MQTSEHNEIPASQTPSLWKGALEEARSLIGVELRRHDHVWNTEAGPDGVRQFCRAIGDSNPLYWDPIDASESGRKAGLAPGCFLYTIDSTIVAPKLQAIQWIYTGTQWEWYHPIRHRDRFTTKVRLIDATEKKGNHASSFIIQTGEVLYYNQHGQLVAKAFGSTARVPRARASGGLSYQPRQVYRYTAEEIAAINAAIDAEHIQGAVPLYWDDVRIGAELQPVVKGPLNVTDMICWYSGGGHIYKAHGLAMKYRKRHPADAYTDPETGAQDHPARGHAQEFMAREVGMPGGYDVGPQRISWVGHLLSNWMGDQGFVRKLDVSVRRPNIFGDTSWCKARIEDKRIDDGIGLVQLSVRVENQMNEVTAVGTATVALPRRK